VSWSLGDLDAAEAAFRDAVAMHRRSGARGKHPLGYCLGNLAGVLTERGKLVEALDAAREGIPLLDGTGYAWVLIDHLALRSALAGKIESAAKVGGYADAAHASKDATRQTNEARARDRLQSLLRARLDEATLAGYLAEGAKLSELEACRLALED
jgi:tetratricopeptide repeat protein